MGMQKSTRKYRGEYMIILTPKKDKQEIDVRNNGDKAVTLDFEHLYFKEVGLVISEEIFKCYYRWMSVSYLVEVWSERRGEGVRCEFKSLSSHLRFSSFQTIFGEIDKENLKVLVEKIPRKDIPSLKTIAARLALEGDRCSRLILQILEEI
jgi:hypothetical protein